MLQRRVERAEVRAGCGPSVLVPSHPVVVVGVGGRRTVRAGALVNRVRGVDDAVPLPPQGPCCRGQPYGTRYGQAPVSVVMQVAGCAGQGAVIHVGEGWPEHGRREDVGAVDDGGGFQGRGDES